MQIVLLRPLSLSLMLPFKTINKQKNKRKAHKYNELFTSKFHLLRPLITRKRRRNPNKTLNWMGEGNLTHPKV